MIKVLFFFFFKLSGYILTSNCRVQNPALNQIQAVPTNDISSHIWGLRDVCGAIGARQWDGFSTASKKQGIEFALALVLLLLSHGAQPGAFLPHECEVTQLNSLYFGTALRYVKPKFVQSKQLMKIIELDVFSVWKHRVWMDIPACNLNGAPAFYLLAAGELLTHAVLHCVGLAGSSWEDLEAERARSWGQAEGQPAVLPFVTHEGLLQCTEPDIIVPWGMSVLLESCEPLLSFLCLQIFLAAGRGAVCTTDAVLLYSY